MNTPNKLTVARMIMVPFFVVFCLAGWGGDANPYICALIFIGASATDWLDGYLARKNNLVTNFGKFMDPLADKLLVCSALICMIQLGRLEAWIVIIIIAREFIISGFRLIAVESGIVIAANYWGKLKTVSQMIMIVLLILDLGGPFQVLTRIFVWLSLGLTVISLVTYLAQNRKVLSMQD
ncbi:MAG: CDP-diacylglycerol--glycerol-3-phosphate 3-phosphatidyltransferase [Eubacteriales bacterium]|nr:CDP-diacylglycerol--glycerol-3-phosphate 3-phosphatidyltransferase [Eubacteriales bacterium]